MGGHEGGFSRELLPVFSVEGPRQQVRHGQQCPFFDVFRPANLLPTAASSALQGVLKDDFGEAFVVRDMFEPCEFPSLDSCQKFLLAYRKVDLAPHPVVGPLLQEGDRDKFKVTKDS